MVRSCSHRGLDGLAWQKAPAEIRIFEPVKFRDMPFHFGMSQLHNWKSAILRSCYDRHDERGDPMFLSRKRLSLPSALDALPGRPDPIMTAEAHFTTGNPLKST